MNKKTIIFMSLSLVLANFNAYTATVAFPNPCYSESLGIAESVDIPNGSCLLWAEDSDITNAIGGIPANLAINRVSIIINDKPETISAWLESKSMLEESILFGIVDTRSTIKTDTISGQLTPFLAELGQTGLLVRSLKSVLRRVGGNLYLRKHTGTISSQETMSFLEDAINPSSELGQRLLGIRRAGKKTNVAFCASFYGDRADIGEITEEEFRSGVGKDVLSSLECEEIPLRVFQQPVKSLSQQYDWAEGIEKLSVGDFTWSCTLI
ncbi:MAG: hypothetical protein LBU35_01570 [Holosporales bacterium]|jgi:hypothetical protein|nr:hypothetical protein [Holosporales bacterium]